MKKILLTLTVIFMTACACFAEDMKVMALNDFSTDAPSEIKVQVLQTMKLDENVYIEAGSIVTGMMIDVVPAKRLKRDATFSFMPTSYITPQHVRIKINRKYVGKFSPKFEMDKTELMKSAALSVGEHFVKGLSAGFYALEGAIKDEKGNRIVSSVNNVYKNSVLSYVEKGEATYIKAESLFTFHFDTPDPEESANLGPAVTKEKEPNFGDIPGFESGSLPAAKPE